MGDLAEAVREAGKLVHQSATLRRKAARLRTELAERLREAEHLSVQQLADRLGVSKGTAQQILERDKRDERRRK